MSEIELLKKELELTKAELVHANETIVLLAKGDVETVTEQPHAELLKTKELLRSAQEEIRSLTVKNGLLGTENRKLTNNCEALSAERSKFHSECSKLRNENKQLILDIPVSSNAYDEVRNKKIKVLHDELDRVNAYCETLKLERSKFQSMTSTLEAENKRLVSMSGKKDKSDGRSKKVIVESNTNLQETIRELRAEKKEYELTLDRLEAENRVLHADNVYFKKENKRLQDDNVSFQEENYVMKSENVVLHSSNVELQSRVTELSVSAGFGENVGDCVSWADEKEEAFKNLNFLVTQIRKNS